MNALVWLWFSLQTTVFPSAMFLNDLDNEVAIAAATSFYSPIIAAYEADERVEAWVDVELAVWEHCFSTLAQIEAAETPRSP